MGMGTWVLVGRKEGQRWRLCGLLGGAGMGTRKINMRMGINTRRIIVNTRRKGIWRWARFALAHRDGGDVLVIVGGAVVMVLQII